MFFFFVSDFQAFHILPKLPDTDNFSSKKKMTRAEILKYEENPSVFYDLCALLFSILRQPPHPSSSPRMEIPISPGEIVSLLLGISLSLMLCGSVILIIGFILLPWIIGIVILFYLLSFLSILLPFFWGNLMPPTTQIPGFYT